MGEQSELKAMKGARDAAAEKAEKEAEEARDSVAELVKERKEAQIQQSEDKKQRANAKVAHDQNEADRKRGEAAGRKTDSAKDGADEVKMKGLKKSILMAKATANQDAQSAAEAAKKAALLKEKQKEAAADVERFSQNIKLDETHLHAAAQRLMLDGKDKAVVQQILRESQQKVANAK